MAGKKSRRDRGHRRQGDNQRCGGRRSALDSEARARIGRWLDDGRLPAIVVMDSRRNVPMMLRIQPYGPYYRVWRLNIATESDDHSPLDTLAGVLDSVSRACQLVEFRPQDDFHQWFEYGMARGDPPAAKWYWLAALYFLDHVEIVDAE